MPVLRAFYYRVSCDKGENYRYKKPNGTFAPLNFLIVGAIKKENRCC